MVLGAFRLTIVVVAAAAEFYVHLKQSAVLLHSQKRKRSNDYIDYSSRIVTFDHDDIRKYTISAVLQPSIVLAGALPDIAGDTAIPQIFKGELRNDKYESVGRAQLHFDSFDKLRYLSIDDGHEDGRLIAEQQFGNMVRHSDEDDLIMYRERPSQVAQRGSCMAPLGWEPPKKRSKRQTDSESDIKKQEEKDNAELAMQDFPRDCKIKLVADDLFDKEIGKGNHDKTMGYMIGVIARANDIFRATDWLSNRDTESQAINFGFTISSIEIWNNKSDTDRYLNRTDIENPSNTDFDEECTQSDSRMICRYLKAFAKKVKVKEESPDGIKTRKVCLAHLFTHKDFPNGILGLAHIGKKDSSASSAMGICAGERDKYNAYLNTALTTTLNWDTKILTAEADLVTAHELGHNWGAGHDNDPKEDYNPSEYQCEPGPPNGKYIMYRNAVSGIFQNNKKFSPCSKFDVLSKLLACGRSSFEMLNEDKCGNYKVNTGEQCDSGIGLSNFNSSQCCRQDCKFNKQVTKPGLKPFKAECDDANPNEHLCCHECGFRTKGTQCRGHTECMQEAVCNGVNATCPLAQKNPDGTPCKDADGGDSKCKDGQCQDVCGRLEMHKCYCNETYALDIMCTRCCTGGHPEECKPAHMWSSTLEPIVLKNNAICNAGNCLEEKDDKGVSVTRCKKNQMDMMEHFNSVFDYLQPSKFKVLVRNNITGAIMIFSIMVWVPAAVFVSYIDRKRRQHNEKTRFQWPDYMSSFSYSTYNPNVPNKTINQDFLRQLSIAKLNQNQGGSYALQVMNQLTHHILSENVKQNNSQMPQTPRSDDFQSAEDYADNESAEPNFSANNNKTAEMTTLLDQPVLHREDSRSQKKESHSKGN